MDATGFAATARARPPEARRDRDGHAAERRRPRPRTRAARSPRPGGCGPRGSAPLLRPPVPRAPVAVRHRLLAGAPGGADQMVVQGDDASAPPARLRTVRAARASWLADPARLVPPRPDRVQADDMERPDGNSGSVVSQCALELGERAGQPRRNVGDVVVAGHSEQGRPERPKEACRILLLLRSPRCVRSPLATISSGLIPRPIHQADLYFGVMAGSEMQVGDVENAGGHDRGRL